MIPKEDDSLRTLNQTFWTQYLNREGRCPRSVDSRVLRSGWQASFVEVVELEGGYPIHLRAYDLLAEAGEDLRPLPFTTRRARLEAFRRKVGPITKV